MSDSGSAAQMREEWDKLQKQMWSAWTDVQRKATEAMGGETGSWHEGLELWERTLRGGGSGPGNLVMDKLIEQGKAYLGMAQALAQSARADQPAASPMDLARQWSDRMRELLGKGGGPGDWFAQALNTGAGDASLLKMHRLFGQLNPMGDAMAGMPGMSGLAGMSGFPGMTMPSLGTPVDEMQGWLKAPTFGFNREKQERQQALANHLIDYQKANQRYNDLMLRCVQQGLERFEDKLIERSEPGRRIESLRGIYDLWIDAMEEAYAEAALGTEFREVYGGLVNAQMRVRQGIQQQVEALTADLGMPTRGELDSVHRRLHELRRAAHAKAEPAAATVDHTALAAEIEALRAELAELRAAVAAAPAASSPAPKAAPAKPSTAKAATATAKPAARRRASKEN